MEPASVCLPVDIISKHKLLLFFLTGALIAYTPPKRASHSRIEPADVTFI